MSTTHLESILGARIAVFNSVDFKKLCKDLPVIARNSLDNGKSTNLWYEEVVPRESRFIFHITRYVYADDDQDKISNLLTVKKNLIQVGGNATVGYGVSQVTKLS